MTRTTTRNLTAGLLAVGILAGCSTDDPTPEESSASSSDPASTTAESPSSSSDTESSASPTSSEPTTSTEPSPEVSSVDETAIYPHGTPHEQLEEGREDGTPPDHIVAKDAYRDGEEVIRAYLREHPVKKTEAGVPQEVRKYVTDGYAANQATNTNLFEDGAYLTSKTKVVGDITPYNWSTQGVDTVTLDACLDTTFQRYNADGSTIQNYDPDGNPIAPRNQNVVRYSLDSTDQGRSWRISSIQSTEKTC